jgi:nodulation protein E
MVRVAVTGLGAVSALGSDIESLWSGVTGGAVGIRPIANIPTDRLTIRIAAEVPDFRPGDHFDARRLPMLDRSSQLALVAAREAIRDSGLSFEGPAARRTGAILGAAIGQGTLDDSYFQLYGQDVTRLHPFTIPRVMPNAPVSHITIEHGIRGPAFSVASACASAAHAIGQAFQMVRAGTVDAAVTGGSDASLVVGYMKSWEALRVLSPDGCRPFSHNRNGLVLGEGAGILVLENLELAEARGARIHGELVGFGMSADGADMTAPDAESAAWAMSQAIADAGLEPADIDYVNAHGTGTRLNDKTETAALRAVFGNRAGALAISASKSMLGHTLAAAGALEMVLTVLALRDGVLPPTMGYADADPDCDLDYVPNAARRAPIEVALSNSFAFGGLNAVLAARHFPQAERATASWRS